MSVVNSEGFTKSCFLSYCNVRSCCRNGGVLWIHYSCKYHNLQGVSAGKASTRVVLYFSFIHNCHNRPVFAVSGSYRNSVLLRATRRAYTTRENEIVCMGERLVSKSYPFMRDTSRSYRSIKRNCGHGDGVSGLYRNSVLL